MTCIATHGIPALGGKFRKLWSRDSLTDGGFYYHVISGRHIWSAEYSSGSVCDEESD
ncbi:hypothetical protein CBL_07268 [Carabus blaptoides fortunei]